LNSFSFAHLFAKLPASARRQQINLGGLRIKLQYNNGLAFFFFFSTLGQRIFVPSTIGDLAGLPL